MRQDLDTLKQEIEQAVAQSGLSVYRGQFRSTEGVGEIFWDSEHYPDPRGFLDVASQLGVKLVVFHHSVLTERMLADAAQKLEDAQMTRDEQREAERTLRKLGGYEGFTCSLQLSFDFEQRTYFYEARTQWFEEFLNLLDSLDDAIGEREDEHGSLGGYFSNN